MAGEHPRPDGPRSPERRRVLIALGYAGASVVALGRLGTSIFGSDGAGGRSDATGTPTGGGHVPAEPVDPPAMAGAAPEPPPGHVFDRVIANGRVIDPASGFDGPANVGVDGLTVAAISREPLRGRQTIDARDRVVAPGFIDLLSYDPVPEGVAYKIGDGVTTNLGMHGIMHDAEDFFARFTGKCAVNFGGAFSDHFARSEHLDIAVGRQATPSQVSQLRDICEQELRKGWIGVDFEPEYTPGVTFEEMRALATVAESHDMVCTFHGRYSSFAKEQQTVPEIVEIAKQTGAMAHVEHLPSTGGTWHIDAALQAIHDARRQGHDVTFGLYPYDYWATYLGSARFNPGWQDRFRISYGDLQVAGTDQRLTESTFRAAQRQNKLVVAYAIPETSVRKALRDPISMIGSDAIYTTGNNHPRATGCFARTLGRYARDLQVISLPDALSKMTIQPAQRFEAAAPALRKKGRLQRGADADITVFDPATVIDQSTVAQPAAFSTGIDWVLVNGTVVKTPVQLVPGVHPGIPVVSQIT